MSSSFLFTLYYGILPALGILTSMIVIFSVYLSRLYSAMRISKEQFRKALPLALILSMGLTVLVLVISLYTDQINLADPLSYGWALFVILMVVVPTFFVTLKLYFIHFGKKNLGSDYKPFTFL